MIRDTIIYICRRSFSTTFQTKVTVENIETTSGSTMVLINEFIVIFLYQRSMNGALLPRLNQRDERKLERKM